MAVVETVYPGNPYGLGLGRALTSPYQFLLDDDTSLRVVSANSVTGVTIGINGLRLDEKGLPQTINETHTPNTDRSTKTQDYRIGRGSLLRLSLFVSAGTPLSGQTYVIAQLVRGITGPKIVIGTLLAGYITGTQALGFPGSPLVPSTAGEPAARVILGTTPAATADIVETVPTGARWELLSVRATLLLGASGAGLPVNLKFDDGANQYFDNWTGNTGAATTTTEVVFSQLVPVQTIVAGSVLFVCAPFPKIRLLAGNRFVIHSNNAAAQVTWSRPVYNVREWLDV